MLSLDQMEQMGMLESVHARKSRVATTTYTVLKIKENVVNDDEKMADLREGILMYAEASQDALGKLNAQYGICTDPSKGTSEVYMFSLYAFPAALDSHVGRVFNAYCNKILPYTDMEELITTTGKEDMEYWTTTLAGYGSQASKLLIMENVNDPEKKPFVDPIPASVEELIGMGLPDELARNCVKAMHGGEPVPRKHRCVMQTISKFQDDVIGDKQRIDCLKEAARKYADASRATEGKLACEVALSEEYNELYIQEHFNSSEASMAHIGRCLKCSVELFKYVYLDQLIVSCPKEDMEYYESCGRIWQPKSKTVVMECIR